MSKTQPVPICENYGHQVQCQVCAKIFTPEETWWQPKLPIGRIFEMGNTDTFQMRKLRGWVLDHLPEGMGLNVFGGKTRLDKPGSTIVHNDIDPDIEADCHYDALDIWDTQGRWTEWFDFVILDPPYTMHQANHYYNGRMVKDISRVMDQCDKLLKPLGTAVTLGYNTTGFGMKRGYVKQAILMVNLGSSHNDILITVEQKA